MTITTESYDAQVGRAVRLVRLLRGMSQAELAKAIGVSQPNICAMEKGRTSWRAEQLALAAAAMGVDVVDIQPKLHRAKVSTAA